MSHSVRSHSENDGLTLYQCAHCMRAFTRLDHLSRHERTHTSEKPHVCTVCSKAFARTDLLKRHWRRHYSDPIARSKLAESMQNASNRVARACIICVASKLKCSDTKPCQRCVRKNIVCRYSNGNPHLESSRGRDEISQEYQIALDENQIMGDGDGSRVGVSPYDPPNSEYSDEGSPSSPREAQNQHQDLVPQLSGRPHRGIARLGVPHLGMVTIGHSTASGNVAAGSTDHGRVSTACGSDGDEVSGDIRAEVSASGVNQFEKILFPEGFFGNLLPENAHHHSIGVGGDLDFLQSSVDPSFDWILDMEAVEDNHRATWRDGQSLELSTFTDAASTPAHKTAAVFTAVGAFKASVWNWIPSPADSAMASQKDISPLPAAVDDAESWYKAMPRLLEKRCLSSDRSRILETLIATCSKDLTVRLVSSFPSPQLMSHLMHVFLHRHSMRRLGWIHMPTFDPSTSLDRLLMAMIAVGACLSQAQPVQSLGYAILELMKTSITTQWESDSSKTRHVQYLQAFSLILSQWFWSGHKRRTELAEGLSYPLVTIFRASGWLRAEHYANIRPSEQDEGDALQERWYRWVEQESRKRLAYEVFMYDAHMSMVNSHAPAMSPSEMRLPLPESDVLWCAETAEEWKWHCIHSRPVPDETPTSMAARVRAVLSGSSSFASTKDDTPSHTVMLYAMWRCVWQFREDGSLLSSSAFTGDRSSSCPAHVPALAKAVRSLYGMGYANGIYSDYRGVHPEATVLHAFLLLNLYAPLDDLQAFAGRYGEGDVAQAHERLQEWILTREARLATWYAAQIIRASQSLARHLLSEFYAFALYEVSITLFGYGTLSAEREQRSRPAPPPCLQQGQHEEEEEAEASDEVVWLCSGPIEQVHKFVALDAGKPAIRGLELPSSMAPRSWSPLGSPGRTLKVVIQILTGGEGNELDAHAPPCFVEGMIALLRELVRAAEAAGHE